MAFDTFAGAAGALTAPWSKDGGAQSMQRDGNGNARAGANGDAEYMVYAGAVVTLGQKCRVIAFASISGLHYTGPMVRYGGGKGFLISSSPSDGTIYLSRHNSGNSGPDIATRTHPQGGLKGSDELELEISPDATNPTLFMRLNGVQLGGAVIWTGTDSSVGAAGMTVFRETGTQAAIAEWEGGDVGGGGEEPEPVEAVVTATMPALQAGSQVAVGVEAEATATLPSLAAGAQVYQPLLSSGIVTLPSLQASGQAQPVVGVETQATLPSLQADAVVEQPVGVQVSAVLPGLAASAQAAVRVGADAIASLPALQASGTVSTVPVATAFGEAVLPPLLAGAQAGVLVGAVVGALLPSLRAGGAALVRVGAGGQATLPSLQAGVVVVITVRGSGQATLPALRASGTLAIDIFVGALDAIELEAAFARRLDLEAVFARRLDLEAAI